MPNHCFTSTVNNATPMNTEWEVVWQPDVTNIMNYSSDDFDSSSKTDDILCDIQRTSYKNMNSASGFSISDNPDIRTVAKKGDTGSNTPTEKRSSRSNKSNGLF